VCRGDGQLAGIVVREERVRLLIQGDGLDDRQCVRLEGVIEPWASIP
jgi:hypothetical protein